jgi:CO dehydrogenase/acetyl-CoA synthase alpha subunit
MARRPSPLNRRALTGPANYPDAMRIKLDAYLDGPRSLDRELPDDWWSRAEDQRQEWMDQFKSDLIDMLRQNTLAYEWHPGRESLLYGDSPDDLD